MGPNARFVLEDNAISNSRRASAGRTLPYPTTITALADLIEKVSEKGLRRQGHVYFTVSTSATSPLEP
jgi:hypothetical protein